MLSFPTDVDKYNFKVLEPGQKLAYAKATHGLSVIDNDDQEVFDQFFSIEDGVLTVKESFIPAMITKNEVIIKDDCFGYIMERYPIT